MTSGVLWVCDCGHNCKKINLIRARQEIYTHSFCAGFIGQIDGRCLPMHERILSVSPWTWRSRRRRRRAQLVAIVLIHAVIVSTVWPQRHDQQKICGKMLLFVIVWCRRNFCCFSGIYNRLSHTLEYLCVGMCVVCPMSVWQLVDKHDHHLSDSNNALQFWDALLPRHRYLHVSRIRLSIVRVSETAI